MRVSQLTAEQKRELAAAKDQEIATGIKHGVVEAAERQGVDPATLMRMRWVTTIKPSGAMKARLVVLGFTDPKLAELRTASPTVSRRGRQIFLALSAAFGWPIAK